MATWRADVNPTTTENEPLAYIVLDNESQGLDNKSQGEGYFVFKFNSCNEILFGDNFYFSLEEAKLRCKEEYGIDEDTWYECPDLDWSSIKEAEKS